MTVKLGIQLPHGRLLAAFFYLSTRSGIAVVPNRSHASAVTYPCALCSARNARLGRKVVDGRFVKKRLQGSSFPFLLGLCLSTKAWKLWAMHRVVWIALSAR